MRLQKFENEVLILVLLIPQEERGHTMGGTITFRGLPDIAVSE